jgi:hypothetical protein
MHNAIQVAFVHTAIQVAFMHTAIQVAFMHTAIHVALMHTAIQVEFMITAIQQVTFMNTRSRRMGGARETLHYIPPSPTSTPHPFLTDRVQMFHDDL